MTQFILTKSTPIVVYFKCKDRTGLTCTSFIEDAMRFKTRDEAINYVYNDLYEDYEVMEINNN